MSAEVEDLLRFRDGQIQDLTDQVRLLEEGRVKDQQNLNDARKQVEVLHRLMETEKAFRQSVELDICVLDAQKTALQSDRDQLRSQLDQMVRFLEQEKLEYGGLERLMDTRERGRAAQQRQIFTCEVGEDIVDEIRESLNSMTEESEHAGLLLKVSQRMTGPRYSYATCPDSRHRCTVHAMGFRETGVGVATAKDKAKRNAARNLLQKIKSQLTVTATAGSSEDGEARGGRR